MNNDNGEVYYIEDLIRIPKNKVDEDPLIKNYCEISQRIKLICTKYMTEESVLQTIYDVCLSVIEHAGEIDNDLNLKNVKTALEQALNDYRHDCRQNRGIEI